MYIACGLGNKGFEYKKTRHNIGFRVIDKLSNNLGIPLEEKIPGCLVASKDDLIIAKPQTFMNLSGDFVLLLVKNFGVPAQNLIIVHDDMDLEFGYLKIRQNGGDGGHKGVRSVIESLKTKDFIRLKIGIGRPKMVPPEEYVLSNFSSEEEELLPEIIERAASAIVTIAKEGVEKAMSIYNRRKKGWPFLAE